MESKLTSSSWLDRPLFSYMPSLKLETLLVALVIILAVISRFYNVDLRVMSHDEVNHVVPSWDLFRGRGYRHDPVTHGPMQFHLVALSYFVMGDNDFSSRVPSVLFSIATVVVAMFGFRRYSGRAGALITGVLFLISPYLLFYGRYTRNESFVGLFGVLTLYGILRYLEKGEKFSLYLLAAVTSLQFATKEVSYIYTAQFLLFMGILFLDQILRVPWNHLKERTRFVMFIILALFLLGIAFGLGLWSSVTPGLTSEQAMTSSGITPLGVAAAIALLAAVAAALVGCVFMVRELGWKVIRSLRSFDLIVVIGTLILPQLAAFPVKIVGWNPLDYSSVGIAKTAVFLVIFAGLAIAAGWWWNKRVWITCASIFYAIFVVLYTTFFTNGQGFFTGIIGSLGYWLAQQGVERGSQPWYYYGLIQIPMYEYLPALGTLLALYFGIRYRRFSNYAGFAPAAQPSDEQLKELEYIEKVPPSEKEGEEVEVVVKPQSLPVLALFVFWAVTSLGAYSIAGEKMPWLTVHIALPLICGAGWGLGYLVDTTPWKRLFDSKGLLTLLLLPVFLAGIGGVVSTLLGNQPPFQGAELEQLRSTSTFLLSVIVVIFSAWGILTLLKEWLPSEIIRLVSVVFFALMAILTARAAYMSSYVNYDDATEYLVYAHAARAPKEVLAQVEEISRRMTRGLDVVVSYDNDGLYPYWWYLRNYPNHKWITDKPTRELRDSMLVIAGEGMYSKLDPIIKDDFIYFDYVRLWWPNQDYFNLTWERLWNAISNRDMRTAIYNIWLNRDYSLYAQLTNSSTLKLENWQPSSRMRFYIRKDVAAQMWNYGASPSSAVKQETDPYAQKMVQLDPDLVVGSLGTATGQLTAPRGVAVGLDGSIYVADSRNHRIQQFSKDGQFVRAWGSYANIAQGVAPDGTFNEPWGIAVGPDGSVYVADTWNHRVQKFTAKGEFVAKWGFLGQGASAEEMWGPRGIAVDAKGQVYVTDTGNKRVAVFTADGKPVTQFGTAGLELGQLDEPVGLAVDAQGRVYVADTWNQRVQVFAPSGDGKSFTPLTSWEVKGWVGQSLENKPFIAVDGKRNQVLVPDPEGYRILVFNMEGGFVLGWSDFTTGNDGFNFTSGVAIGSDGMVWVSDAGNNRVLRFKLPSGETISPPSPTPTTVATSANTQVVSPTMASVINTQVPSPTVASVTNTPAASPTVIQPSSTPMPPATATNPPPATSTAVPSEPTVTPTK